MIVPPDPVALTPSGDEVTVYEVIARAAVEAGGVKVTTAVPFPGVAETPVGAPGTVRGVTAFEAVEAGPVPAALVAVTVKV